MQNCGMAPPFVTWAEGLSTETVGEDLFFGQKLDYIRVKTFFFSFLDFT